MAIQDELQTRMRTRQNSDAAIRGDQLNYIGGRWASPLTDSIGTTLSKQFHRGQGGREEGDCTITKGPIETDPIFRSYDPLREARRPQGSRRVLVCLLPHGSLPLARTETISSNLCTLPFNENENDDDDDDDDDDDEEEKRTMTPPSYVSRGTFSIERQRASEVQSIFRVITSDGSGLVEVIVRYCLQVIKLVRGLSGEKEEVEKEGRGGGGGGGGGEKEGEEAVVIAAAAAVGSSNTAPTRTE
ncbi:hypothetical protein V1478_014344 [Vespula squamosa]|uniref:Uncharacterized protein n=1 Tax=Vespula squamosa TaxID=30214 RepID=A0ABD2A7R8_VESSQ